MHDPTEWFGRSLTKMHSIERKELDDMLREAMAIRFADHKESIEAVGKAAKRTGVTELRDFDDVVPLMFSHAAYKSYPAALLDRKRYDLLTAWLDKLTKHDLSQVDVSGCTDIDSWIEALDEQTPLEAITSSGTTGTLSIIPKDREGAEINMRSWLVMYFQTFGQEPTEDELEPAVDVIWPNFASGKLGHLRMADMLRRNFTGGDSCRFHPMYGDAVSTDLMFLASKLRAAASRGELDRIEIDPDLLARKSQLEEMQARMPEDMARFLQEKLRELAGKQVFVMGSYNLLYELSTEGLARGRRGRVRAQLRGGQRRRGEGHRAAARLAGAGAQVLRRRPPEHGLRHVGDLGDAHDVRVGPLPRAALGHPLRARPGHERAAPTRGRADRPGRVLRPRLRRALERDHVR